MALDATLGAAALGGAAQSPIAAAPLAIVQNIAGLPGRVTRVLIEPEPGREAQLQRALTARYGATLNARPIDTEATAARRTSPFAERQVTLLFSVIALVAGIVLAYNALLLASDERRRFIV